MGLPEGSKLMVLAPVIQANEAITGIYMLSVEGPGTRMNNGGPFSLRAGQTVELGQMRLGGAATNVEAELTLSIDGQTYACPVNL